MYDLLKKITHKLFSENSGLKRIFILRKRVLPINSEKFLQDWKEKEIVLAATLPDRIFALLIESEIDLSFFVSVKEREKAFSFIDFAAEHFSIGDKNFRVKEIGFLNYEFSSGDIIYLLQENKGGQYEAYVYEKI